MADLLPLLLFGGVRLLAETSTSSTRPRTTASDVQARGDGGMVAPLHVRAGGRDVCFAIDMLNGQCGTAAAPLGRPSVILKLLITARYGDCCGHRRAVANYVEWVESDHDFS